MRTTVDIDDPVLKEVKTLQQKQGKSLGRIISDLLAQALEARKVSKRRSKAPVWISKAMAARINLDDKEGLYGAMEKPLQSNRGTGRP